MTRRPIAFRTATALVTGAGSGIGRATALALAARGATVLCTDIDDATAESTAAECVAQSLDQGVDREHFAYGLNVADRSEVDATAVALAQRHGPLTILVNNAGIGMTGAFSDMTEDDWSFIRSINLDGVVNCCSAFCPPMLALGYGHVVNISSGLGFTPTAKESAYGTTKAAVLHLSQCLRADWARCGVGVTAICPGFINTPIATATRFTGGLEDPTARARIIETFRRGHPPEKVANAVVGAISANRSVVPVGWEAVLGWYAHRLAPSIVQQTFARLSAGR